MTMEPQARSFAIDASPTLMPLVSERRERTTWLKNFAPQVSRVLHNSSPLHNDESAYRNKLESLILLDMKLEIATHVSLIKSRHLFLKTSHSSTFHFR